MSDNASIEIPIAQLLELRHIPTPTLKSRPAANAAWLGSFNSRTRGHGTDYDDLRPYSAGDDIRHIDWRASARTFELHTRLYREEKQHKITLICDLRPCMFTGSKQLRANRAVTVSARLLWQACGAGTHITLIIITASDVCMMASGSGHVTAIHGCKLLADEHQRLANELNQHNSFHGNTIQTTDQTPPNTPVVSATATRRQLLTLTRHGPALDTVLQWILTQGDHKTSLFWISGFDYEGDSFFNTLGAMGSHSVNIAIHVDDPVLGHGLPGGEFHYIRHDKQGRHDPGHYNSKRINARNQKKLEDLLAEKKRYRAAQFDELMIPYLTTAHGDDELIAALRHKGYLP